jgi:hypothetical protein
MRSSKRVDKRDRQRDAGKYEMTSIGVTGHRSLNEVKALTAEFLELLALACDVIELPTTPIRTAAMIRRLNSLEQTRSCWLNENTNSRCMISWQPIDNTPPQTDKPCKLHQALRPWDELPDAEKEKNRILVRDLPDILAKADCMVDKVG